MKRFFPTLAACVLALCANTAGAFQAGLRQLTVPGTGDKQPILVALYYPTAAPSRTIPMGPYHPDVAPQGAPEASFKGLIILSHGTGGSELVHSSLAEALARDGYLVAALRHPGDNWQDVSLRKDPSGAFFTERPRQVTRVIDALLADPQWRDRIARDASGPRIGAVGHSAGGYTVLALAGGAPDVSRLASHCTTEGAQDPILCGLRTQSRGAGAPAPTPQPVTSLGDPRVRAVVALSPLGVVFTPESLAAIHVPIALYVADDDRYLVPRFHAEWVARNVPGVEMHHVSNAWHFAFADAPTMPVPSEDGDIGADPPGFDRAAFLKQLAQDIPAFFDRVFP